jgi:putative ABC transport system permease protein
VPTTDAPVTSRLRPADLARLATVGLRTRRLRAALSALGITIGVAAIVGVLGLSASSPAGLLAEISALGTNLLTVTNGQDLNGGIAELPEAAPSMIARLPGVTAVTGTGTTSASAYRTPLIPAINTNALTVSAASAGLPAAVGTSVAQGSYLNAATARQPVAVLGAAAAQLLGIDRVWPGERIWVGGMWFYVTGILAPAPRRSTSRSWSATPPPGITSASTAARPPSMSRPRPARSPPSITCSPGRPTPRNPRM